MLAKKRKRFIGQIVEINDLTPTVKEFTISTPREFDFYPGQFVTLRFRSPQGTSQETLGRSYSITSTPDLKENIRLCIKLVHQGKVTPTLFNIPPKEVNVIGPMGSFFLTQEDLKKNLVFISTGTGVAPIKSMIEDLLLIKKHLQPITLVTGFREEKEILYQTLWHRLQNEFPHFYHETLVSQPRQKNFTGLKGRVDERISQHLDLDQQQLFVVCGLTLMIESVKKILLSRQIPEDHIRYEKYD